MIKAKENYKNLVIIENMDNIVSYKVLKFGRRGNLF